MISCASIQKLERYGYLGLKRHSTEDFVSTSVKDAKRANVYALTLLETWQEAVQAIRGDAEPVAALSLRAAPARFTDALVYAMSFAVALTSQHLVDVSTKKTAAASSPSPSSPAPTSPILSDDYTQALQLLETLKEMGLVISSGRALRSNASSDDFTKAVSHLLTSVVDLTLVLLSTYPTDATATSAHASLLAQALVLVAATSQMLRRVQASYPVAELFHTRPCAALLKQIANKQKQQQQQQRKEGNAKHDAKASTASVALYTNSDARTKLTKQPLLDILRRYVEVCTTCGAGTAAASAASLFSVFSLFQRLGMLHGALSCVVALPGLFNEDTRHACSDVQHWLSQLLSSTACNRATRYVVYFREDELRLMQHNIRQASEYALYTCTTTPPVDPGLVEQLLHAAEVSGEKSDTQAASSDSIGSVANARAALVLAQWCVSAPFFFESFCRDETWAAFAQEQRRLVLLQQSRARRGLEKTTTKQQRKKERRDGDASEGQARSSSRSSSVSSNSSHTSHQHAAEADTASLLSFQAAASHRDNASLGGSVTSLASRVSLLSTLSKHSAASYLSFISILRPSLAGNSVAGGRNGTAAEGGNEEGDGAANAERQMHESEDGNTNLPLILLEQLTLGLHRFMEAYPVQLLDAYGLRSVSWNSIARMYDFVEASLTRTCASAAASSATGALPQPLFSLAQDLRYNRGMGYECLGLLFAKVVAPLLDVTQEAAILPSQQQLETEDEAVTASTKRRVVKSEEESESDTDSQAAVGADDAHSIDGDRTEAGFFANAAAAAATVGRASLSPTDDAVTRARVEEALSACLTAYESVAPQVVDMNLATILRLAARTAAKQAQADTAAAPATTTLTRAAAAAAAATPVSWSGLLLTFLQGITRRLGRNNELPHLVDALLGRGEAARTANNDERVNSTDREEEEDLNLRALRVVFQRASVRRALSEAAGMSLDPESLLLHLSSIAAELEDSASESHEQPPPADAEESGDEESERDTKEVTARRARVWRQRTLLTLELMEAVLEGVAPTSVSASAVLEQTTQLELLLTSSFVECVKAFESMNSTNRQKQQQRAETQRLLLQHLYTVRQCRAVTALCLQDLGTQQVHEYLTMLDETLWQLSSDVGHLVGPLTLTELASLTETEVDEDADEQRTVSFTQLLLPSLVLQRLSLARAVTAALGTTAGPAEQLQELVAYLWKCLSSTETLSRHSTAAAQTHDCMSLLLANQITADEWVSLVALGKEKHARAAMVALLKRSTEVMTRLEKKTAASWMSCCLHCIPGTMLRALVDVYVTLSMEDVCEALTTTEADDAAAVQQWLSLVSSLACAYHTVGHNPYWPSVLTHTVRALAYLTRVWRKAAKTGPLSDAASRGCAQLAGQLTSLLLCVLRSESRAVEVLRKTLHAMIRASQQSSSAPASAAAAAAPALSRSGLSVAYVESIKVPATMLSDLSAPATTSAAAANHEDEAAQSAALAELRDLSFEEELRDLCSLLFSPTFVKHTFTLVDLVNASASSSSDSAGSTTTCTCMSLLAFVYQVSNTAALTAWRARVTGGDLAALMQTSVVAFLHAVAQSFHDRAAASFSGTESSGTIAAALCAFLQPFYASEEHFLFHHIASSSSPAAASPHRRLTDSTAAGEDEAVSAPPPPPASTKLDEVESLWKSTLRHCALSALLQASSTDLSHSDSSSVSLHTLLRVLLAQLLTSTQHKLQHMSKGGSGAKRSHQGEAASARAPPPTAAPRNQPANAALVTLLSNDFTSAGAPSTAAAVAVEALMRDILSADGPSDSAAESSELCKALAAFFGFNVEPSATKAGKNGKRGGSATAACARQWKTMTHDGAEAGTCAFWLLWKLFCVSVTLLSSSQGSQSAKTEDSSVREASDAAVPRLRDVREQVDRFLSDCYTADNVSAASSAAAMSASDESTTTLRAISTVLNVLPAEAAPPLLYHHLHNVLTHVIPDTQPSASASTATTHSATAIAAAAELLLQLFRVRPRLPAWRLLPPTQRLLVWLTHPRARCADERLDGPSLSLLSIRLCAAVAAHPAVSSRPSSSSSPSLTQPHDVAASLKSVSGELLDNVWLLLLSLAESSSSESTVAHPHTQPMLRESDAVQLILLLTRTWLRSRQQQLWSRPAMLPAVLCALFVCVMRGMEAQRYTPRVLNVLAGGLAAVAAHVDVATAAEGDNDASEGDESSDDDNKNAEAKANGSVSKSAGGDEGARVNKKAKTEAAPSGHRREKRAAAAAAAGASSSTPAVAISAQLKRAALAAATADLFEVSQHYVHVFTAYSSDMDFLFTDFLRVLSQHFLPTVTRPPIAYHAGVTIGGTTRSEMTFADLAYTCVGHAESKSLLKQAALRMEEEDGSAGTAALRLTDGGRSIFHVA